MTESIAERHAAPREFYVDQDYVADVHNAQALDSTERDFLLAHANGGYREPIGTMPMVAEALGCALTTAYRARNDLVARGVLVRVWPEHKVLQVSREGLAACIEVSS
jgi:hypothetical protein